MFKDLKTEPCLECYKSFYDENRRERQLQESIENPMFDNPEDAVWVLVEELYKSKTFHWINEYEVTRAMSYLCKRFDIDTDVLLSGLPEK